METVDAAVVGAGVVGLAVASALARRGLEVLVFEGESAIGTGISSRNSEVIHAGLYYPAGSLKARLCVEGRNRLYAWCEARGVAHRRCGKLVVATREPEIALLRDLAARAASNGVADLRWLDAREAKQLEPALECVAALHCPSTGIVDSHGLMVSLHADLESAGGLLALHAPVSGIVCGAGVHVLQVGGEAPMEIAARFVVNAAGMGAPALAARITGLASAHVPAPRYSKGSYFALTGRAPFSHLIYPVPTDWALGIHLTLDLGGQARFGPDAEWVAPDLDGMLDYQVDPCRAERFYDEVRRYWPALRDDALSPAFSGIRPKISYNGAAATDFIIQGVEQHTVPGLVNLFGIESPGLTSSLALAEEVSARLGLPACGRERTGPVASPGCID